MWEKDGEQEEEKDMEKEGSERGTMSSGSLGKQLLPDKPACPMSFSCLHGPVHGCLCV